MLSFFQSKNPLMFIFYFFIGGGIAFAIPNKLLLEINNQNVSFLHQQLLFLIKGDYFNMLYKLIIAFLLIINAYLFNSLILRIKLYRSNNMFFGFVFLFFIAPAVVFVDATGVLIASFFIILAIFIMLKTLNKTVAIFSFFNVGLLFAIAFLFWKTTLYFTPIIFISLLVLRISNWREWIVPLIGFFIPVFFFISAYFFIFSNFDMFFEYLSLIPNSNNLPELSVIQYVYISFLVIMLIVSTFKIISRFNSLETFKQDFYKIFFFLFLNFIVLSIFFHSSVTNLFIIGAISLSIPFSIFIQSINKRILAESFFSIFLVLSVLSIINLSF